MSQASKPTKQSSYPPEVITLARRHPERFLAWSLLAAAGISLGALIAVIKQILAAGAWGVMIMALAAGVQIRANVVAVGNDVFGIRDNYKALVIVGQRAVQDSFNYGAFHVLGHMFALLAPDNSISTLVLSKAGNCVSGKEFPDTEAGKINAGIRAGWMKEDLQLWDDFLAESLPMRQKTQEVMAVIPLLAADFTELLSDPAFAIRDILEGIDTVLDDPEPAASTAAAPSPPRGVPIAAVATGPAGAAPGIPAARPGRGGGAGRPLSPPPGGAPSSS